MMIPTTIAFKEGKKTKRATGLRLENVLLNMVK
jgi:thioredoxin 1